MNRRKRTLAITLLILLLPPVWITYREYRQARLDHALIEAILEQNDQKALEALAEGASGETMYTREPPTFRDFLIHLWNRVRLADVPPTDPTGNAGHISAIVLYCDPPMDHPHVDLSVVRALLDHGAKVNDRNIDGWTPLWYATFMNNSDLVNLLLSRGTDVDAKNTNGGTPLMESRSAKVTQILLEHGANVEARNDDQQTPLIWATYDNQSDKVQLLLEFGAKVSATDAHGKNALDYARENVKDDPTSDTPKIIALLRRYGAK